MWLGWILAAAGAAILLRGVRLSLAAAPGASAAHMKFTGRRVFSESEKALYWRMRDALPDHIVCCHMGLSQFVRTGVDAKLAKRMQLAFVQFLVTRNDGSPLAAIELLNEQPKLELTAFKEHVMSAAGIAYIRLPHYSVSPEELQKIIRDAEGDQFEAAPPGKSGLLSGFVKTA